MSSSNNDNNTNLPEEIVKLALIKKLSDLVTVLENYSKKFDDGQISFIADGISAVLHASCRLETAKLFMSHIEKYLLEYELLTKQISMKGFLESNVDCISKS